MGTTTQIDPEVIVALQGTLDSFALPDVLRLLAATRKTGCLRITGGRGSGSVWVDDGAVVGVEVAHAPDATEAVPALFELLRFEEGSFAFDADTTCASPGDPQDVEPLLETASEVLAEWRQIEAVVPSLDAWVTLRRCLDSAEVTIDQGRWNTLVAVGRGATVRRIAEELCLSELPVSRAVRDLVEHGLADVSPAAPQPDEMPLPAATPGASHVEVHDEVHDEVDVGWMRSDDESSEVAADLLDFDLSSPADADSPTGATGEDGPLPTARPLRARRARGVRAGDPDDQREQEAFVPLELPGHLAARGASVDDTQDPGLESDDVAAMDDRALAAAFPGLASRLADPSPEDEEVARQLATLSPRAAEAVRAAAEAATAEERDAALDEAIDGEEEPINRGLLLKFLSSVKS